MVDLVNPTGCEKKVEKWINRNSDNGFKNNISSLFQKDFIRMWVSSYAEP